jgi:hypothetical protein
MNPYTPSSSRLFYGREKICRELLENEEAGQSVVLVGGRRCGKTRLVERIKDYLLAQIAIGTAASGAWPVMVPDALEPQPIHHLPYHWPVHVNFQGMHYNSLNQVLIHIAAAITAANPPIKEIPTLPPMNTASPEVLEKWLLQLDRLFFERNVGGLALLLDEIEELFMHPWHHDFMSFLRRLVDFSLKTRVWIVVVGSDGLDNYRNDRDGSQPLNTHRRMYLTGLDYRARRRMAIEPFTQVGRLPPADEILRKVDEMAGGNVWLLTLVLEQLFKAGAMTFAVLEQTGELLLEQQDIILRRWARPLGPKAWELYGQLAQRGCLAAAHFKDKTGRSIRALLEYQALVHRRHTGDTEMGPFLFRDWALEEGKIKEPFASRPESVPGQELLPPGHYRYDVAISFATPQHAIASELARELRKLRKEVFYDRDLGHELWGMDLAECLPETYDRQARVTVLLISNEYVQRFWTMVEKAAALKKALREGWQAVLLVSLDGTLLPEVPGSIVYMDLSKGDKTIAHVALALEARLNKHAEKGGIA